MLYWRILNREVSLSSYVDFTKLLRSVQRLKNGHWALQTFVFSTQVSSSLESVVTVRLGPGHIDLDMLLFVKQSPGFDTSMAILIHKQESYQVLQFGQILVWVTLWRVCMLRLVLYVGITSV